MTATSAAAGDTATSEGPHRGLGRRAGWVMLDQAVSSLANAALSIVVARSVPAADYGAFAVAFSVYTLVVAVSQALAGQVVVIRYSAVGGEPRRRAVSGATGAAVALGLVCAVAVAAVAVTLSSPLREVLLAMGILLPALLLQDTWRSVFVARGTPAQAFVNDLLWTVLQFALIAVLLATSQTSAAWLVAAWGVAAIAAAVYGCRQSGQSPSLRRARPFVLRHRDVSLPAIANAITIMGAIQAAFVLVAVVGSVESVGALRAAQTLLGPLNIIGFAVTAFAVPEIVRRGLTRRGLTMAALAISGLLVVVDLAWGAVLLLVPDSVGTQLLGDTWSAAREALPGLVVFTATVGATVGAATTMRALARTDYAFWVSALLGPLVLVASVLGVSAAGAAGAAWGFAAAGVLVIPVAWALHARALHRPRAHREEEG